MQKVAIVGTTSWGMTLAGLLIAKKLEVRLWARTQQEADNLSKHGPDPTRFPEISLPPNTVITSDAAAAMGKTSAVIMAVPSQSMRQNLAKIVLRLSRRPGS